MNFKKTFGTNPLKHGKQRNEKQMGKTRKYYQENYTKNQQKITQKLLSYKGEGNFLMNETMDSTIKHI